MRISRCILGVALALGAGAVIAQTAPPDLTLEEVTDQVPAPIGVRAPNDGSGRLFVISQAGSIRIINADGTLRPTPFLTLSVTFPGSGGTSGLLGLAFHPNYGQSGLPHNDEFYVVYMRSGNCSAPGSCLGSGPDEVMERYTVSEADPNVANPTGTVVLRLADNSPPSFHNGGDIHFGPDGYLYMSSGDGGQESGTHWLAECLWKKPNDTTSDSCGDDTTPAYFLRGKMLRIDVDTRGEIAGPEMCGTATGASAEYSIPPTNPYVGTSQTCDETFLYGFRNPWRFSFDRENGDMWIGDVGQDHFEEINLRANGSTQPQFYGWHCMEGTAVFNKKQICTPPLPHNVLPTMEYDHTGPRCAVTGGYRFRGPIPEFQGMYVFADSCSSEIFFAKPDDEGGQWSFTMWRQDATGYGTYSGFGEDQAGNLYVANTARDIVYRFHSDATVLTHTVTPSAGAHGTIAPDTPQTVNDGATTVFTIEAAAGYAIADVSGCAGTLVGNTYTTGAITADCEVTATFALGPAEIVFDNGFDP